MKNKGTNTSGSSSNKSEGCEACSRSSQRASEVGMGVECSRCWEGWVGLDRVKLCRSHKKFGFSENGELFKNVSRLNYPLKYFAGCCLENN